MRKKAVFAQKGRFLKLNILSYENPLQCGADFLFDGLHLAE